MSGRPQTAKLVVGCPLDGGVRRHVGYAGMDYGSTNFHVFAPSKRRTRTDAMSSGSKLARLTPCLPSEVGCNGSQCVTQPQVLQWIVRSVLSPHEYSAVASGCPVILT